MILYHRLATTYGRTPHEWALCELDVPGVKLHPSLTQFDLWCMQAWAEELERLAALAANKG